MKKTLKKAVCMLLCIVFGVLALAACDLTSEFSSDDSDTKEVKVKNVESDGQKITVIYEDGYTVEVTARDLISYERLMISVGDSAGKDDKFFDYNFTVNGSTGGSYGDTIVGSSNVVVETTEDGEVKYSYSYGEIIGSDGVVGSGSVNVIQIGSAYGVRVLGTDRDPLGSSGGQLTGTVVNGSSFAGSFSSSATSGGLILQLSGGYESYESYITELIAELFTEITVVSEIDLKGNAIKMEKNSEDAEKEEKEEKIEADEKTEVDANKGGEKIENIGKPTVERILSGGFSGLTKLQRVTLPSTIKVIEDAAFYNCPMLTEIVYNGTMDEWLKIEKGADWDKDAGDYVVRCTDGVIAKK